MKKITIISSSLLIAFALTACQSVSAPDRNSAVESKEEKATSASQVSLTVKGDETNTSGTVTPSNLELPIKGISSITVNEDALSPEEVTASVGDDLIVVNATKEQAQLYTTADGTAPCPFIDASFNLDAGGNKVFSLNKAGSCTVINQLKTSQKTVVNVK